MDPFSCQQLHSLLEVSAYYPNTPVEMPLQVGELTDCSSYFPFYNTEATSEVSATDLESISSLDQLRRILPVSDSQIDYYSSPVVDPHGGEEAPTQQASVGKKRRNLNRPSLSSRQSKGGKNKKQKDPLGGSKAADHEMKATKACKEAPTGYIHVRARRGQATDSHSLAERVRRERISERMKMLQDLVPGCERVTGKALVLDEIINYVQSLQNQIEFLSMRLASLSPLILDLGDHYGDCMNQGEITGSMRQPIPEAANHVELTGFEIAEDYTMVDSSASFLLQEQGPTTLYQDNEGFLVQVDHHGHKYVEQNLTFMW